MNDLEYVYLKSKILSLTKINLDNYKSGQMRRRLEGFIDRTQRMDVTVYCQRLDHDPKSVQDLRDFLTINVSEFFRDTEPFRILETRIFPILLRANQNLKIWSAGCSIGAEPYSLAMILQKISPGRQHRILATDLDTKILARAAAGGPYSASEVKGVPREFIARHMEADGKDFRVAENIKGRVEFKQHDLLTGPPESDFDLILCRNVMIYFTDKAKDYLHTGFARSLKNQGVLFLGSTEALLDFQERGLKRLHTSFYQKDGGVPAEDRHHPAPKTTSTSTSGLIRAGR